MPLPVRHLPVVQNWDCHAGGSCCKEYIVEVTADERQRVESQGWDRDADLGGLAPFVTRGPPWRRKHFLNHRDDGSCVFLSPEGRCRIHERHGYETKPLPCRLFPFVLVPAGDHWRVGMRYACPSAAANLGRPLAAHDDALREFADQLAEREKLTPQPDGSLTAPPPLIARRRVSWPDLHRCQEALSTLLRNRNDPLERRLRKCLTLGAEMQRARLDAMEGDRLGELLKVLRRAADAETPPNLMTLPPPTWVGRILFRQALALFTRKDHGPNRGVAGRGRAALFAAAVRFARGVGPVPRMHAGLPEATFEEAETPRGPLPMEAEAVLERYLLIKVGSLQFCGPANFGLSFWEGFEELALTFPMILWTSRMFRDLPREEAVTRSLTVVDDHFGFNRLLATTRQRVGFRILARRGELSRLIGWYSR
jgi:lysine-N-methylase